MQGTAPQPRLLLHEPSPFTPLLQSIQKKNKTEMEVCFITIVIASHFQAQKQDNWLCSKEICLLAEARSEELCLK